MSLRAAIVGCGKIGSEFSDDSRVKGIYSHAGAYAISSRARLVAVCDADGARAEKCARRWKLGKSYTDVSVLLAEERPDIVSVCTPDETHAAILRTVLDAPGVRGVLAEKPLAMRADEAMDLVRVAAERDIKLAVNYVRRYAVGHRRLRSALLDGAIGAIQNVSGLYTGGLLHNGTHWFDLARWLLGEIATVQGFAPGDQSSGPDPGIDVRLTFASGARAVLQACRSEAFSVFEMDVTGTRGRVRLVDSGHRLEFHSAGDSPYYSGYRSLLRDREESGGLDDMMVNAVEDLAESVASGRAPICSGADGVAALRIAEAARASLHTGRPAVLPP